MAPTKKRGKYKKWQFDGNLNIPRSTRHSRRIASQGIQKPKRGSNSSVKKRASCRSAVSYHQLPASERQELAAGAITCIAAPTTANKENVCPEAGRSTVAAALTICADPPPPQITANEGEGSCPQIEQDVSTAEENSRISDSFLGPSHEAENISDQTEQEEIISQLAANSTDANLPCVLDFSWLAVEEEKPECEAAEYNDEEEPFTLRLEIDEEEMTANKHEQDGTVGGDDSESDDELTQAPDFHMSVPESVKLLLLLATKKRHKLSYTGAEDVMELAGILDGLENAFCPSRHAMKATMEKFSFALTEHHVCPDCGEYFGVLNESHFHCLKCNQRVNTKKNRRSGNMFLYLSLREQIKALLEILDEEDFNYPHKRHKINENNYEDIYDGQWYKSLKVGRGTLTLNFFVDGLQIATTSKQSAWPVLVTINELPLHLRRKHILMASVWLSKKKPNINQYLKPFVKESIDLSSEGIKFKKSGLRVEVTVKPCMCISDSIARPLLRNSTQFNGRFGCGFCYHPGILMAKGRGETRSYSTKEMTYPLRKHEELVDLATRADQLGQRQRGIVGKSILSSLPHFDMVRCIDLDSFHAIVNMAKRFCSLWFDESSTGKAFCIRARLDEVDKRLLSVSTNSDISRAPRSLTERSDYRGHEWFYFVFIYSVPVLKNILPPKYLNHWSLVVVGLSLLMQNSVSKSEVAYSERYLNQFTSEIDDLYGPENVTFSIHLLTHLGRSVRDFGQPWTHSAFLYESYMNEIKTAVKSSNGASLQIAKAIQLNVALGKMETEFHESMTEKQKLYFNRMLGRGKRLAPPHLILPSAAFLGKPNDYILSLADKRAILRAGVNINTQMTVPAYERCISNGILYHSQRYCKVLKQNNSVVLLHCDSVFTIESFIIINQDCFMLGYNYPKVRKKLVDVHLPHFYMLSDAPDSIVKCIHLSQVACKLIHFTVSISASEKVNIACMNVLKLEMLT